MIQPRIVIHVTIRGRVQGVGYRAWVESQAAAFHLEGWVRNRSDGSVEAVFAGIPRSVAEMVAACRRGPSAAHVEDVIDEPGSEEQLGLRPPGKTFAFLPTV